MDYVIEHRNDNYDLLIVFQGFDSQLFGKNSKELPHLFYNSLTTSTLPLNFIFFKDISQTYFNGMHEAALQVITDYQALHPRAQTFTLGKSAGGFNAILMGQAIKADKILAICPQTDLAYYDSGKGQQQHPRLKALQGSFDLPCTNLAELQPFKYLVDYWYPPSELDTWHFNRLDQHDKNLKVTTFVHGHNIANSIGKENFLNKVFDFLLK